MKKLRIAAIAASIAALSIVGASSAVTVAPNANDMVYQSGNPKCPGGFAYTLKIEDDDLGVGTYGAIDITAYDGKYVSWAINSAFLDTYDANLVIVKGGPNAMLYFYTDITDDWDTNLRAPINPNNGKPYGISHVSFCFDPKA